MDDNKIKKNKDKLDRVKKAQIKNIDAILAQAEKLKILEEKAAELEEEARIFSKTAYEVKRKVACKRKRDKMFVLGLVFFSVFLSYILGGSLYAMLTMGLAGGIIFGIFYGNDREKTVIKKPNVLSKNRKKEPKKSASIKRNLEPTLEPTFNNDKYKAAKKYSRSENKISHAPRK